MKNINEVRKCYKNDFGWSEKVKKVFEYISTKINNFLLDLNLEKSNIFISKKVFIYFFRKLYKDTKSDKMIFLRKIKKYYKFTKKNHKK